MMTKRKPIAKTLVPDFERDIKEWYIREWMPEVLDVLLMDRTTGKNIMWGTGAINLISNRLQQELPGLRGFSATNMKSMRLFFEAWFGKIVTSANRQLPTADLLTLPVIRQLPTAELKAGMFRPSYLGQLNFYLSALDEKVRRPDENPSVGLVLCEEANRRFVELAIRDVRKPIGVATYKTDRSVPPAYRRLVPLMNGVNEILEGR